MSTTSLSTLSTCTPVRPTTRPSIRPPLTLSFYGDYTFANPSNSSVGPLPDSTSPTQWCGTRLLSPIIFVISFASTEVERSIMFKIRRVLFTCVYFVELSQELCSTMNEFVIANLVTTVNKDCCELPQPANLQPALSVIFFSRCCSYSGAFVPLAAHAQECPLFRGLSELRKEQVSLSHTGSGSTLQDGPSF